MATTVEIKDIGPVEELSFELGNYGLHVLEGKQGAGKTTILRTIELAVNGSTDNRPVKRDGAKRGIATVAGKTLRIMSRVTEEGDIGVASLGDLSIADLHTPKFKTPETRDKHRITTLVRLGHVKSDAALFYELLSGEERFKSIVPVDSLKTDDLVEMAARVKRAIEKEAIRIEEQAKTALADARAQASNAEGIDTEQPCDEAKLQQRLEDAVRESTEQTAEYERLVALDSEAKRKKEAARLAKERLDAIGAGQDPDHLRVELAEAKEVQEKWSQEVGRLEVRLASAKASLAESCEFTRTTNESLQSALREAALHVELHAAIESGHIDGPSAIKLEDAFEAKYHAAEQRTKAREAITEGVKVRQAIEAKRKSEEHTVKAEALVIDARRLRDAARDTAQVLTDAIKTIPNCPLRVRLNDDGDPRLVIATDRSDAEPFEELSDGERWLEVVKIAAASNRLIVLPQAAFGELSESSRGTLDRLAREQNCYILTAVASDCELQARPWKSC